MHFLYFTCMSAYRYLWLFYTMIDYIRNGQVEFKTNTLTL